MERKTATAVGIALGVLTLGAMTVPLAVHADPSEDPATAALPVMVDEAVDPAKSVVVRLDFASRTETSVASSAVSIQRAHSHVGDPPLLRLKLADGDGSVFEELNAWSPLWVFTTGDTERLEIQESGSGSFVVPFSPELATMTVEDVALGVDVAEVDLTEPIREFCTANPDDPDCVEADLAVQAVAVAGPLFAVLGDPVAVDVTSTVANLGPDGPVDAKVTRTVAADAGLQVSPADPVATDVPGLAVGTPSTLDRSYEVECVEPGVHELAFTTSIAPELAAVVDPVSANDSVTETFEVDCAVPVTINIQPGSTKNPVKLSSGVLPLAVLTTEAGEYGVPLAFDATTIDPLSVRFASQAVLLGGGGVAESHGTGHPDDSLELDERTRDGDTDLVLHFGPRSSALTTADTEGCVLGRFDGPSGSTAFFGCDAVAVK